MTDISNPNQPFDDSQLRQLRAAYVEEVKALTSIVTELRAVGRTDEEIAIEVYRLRREIGVKYKDLTPLPQREVIYRRNLELYGNELGPTFEYLRNIQNKTWEEIIESATRTNPQYNRRFGVEKEQKNEN
ncbi:MULTISPECIES: hypothetical protein [Kamptonema]|uniref:hypothetical protein n=1 Tax=Kamptonema TaxID=1501433 RepID=UPI0001DAC8F9|nr:MULTISPECIES: hypothetical protein [Kamptonema]CBN53843.1 hypothetical protein OSCI_280005 [Kamptonema sp. PCC 6506]